MTDLFSVQGATPSPMQAPRPTGWRAPDLPLEHVCRTCSGAAVCGIGEAWFCTACVPDDWFPTKRTGR